VSREERSARQAHNESIFREVNERIAPVSPLAFMALALLVIAYIILKR
jgi:hypothetical protein